VWFRWFVRPAVGQPAQCHERYHQPAGSNVATAGQSNGSSPTDHAAAYLTADQPAADEPTANQPTANQPAADESADNQGCCDRPHTHDRRGTGEPHDCRAERGDRRAGVELRLVQ
jgi:hypothetical protein